MSDTACLIRKTDPVTQWSVKKRSQPKVDETFISGLISVIIPTFDRKELVQEALASVVQQTWPNIEIIVVDDGSTDGTVDCLETWHNDNPEIAFKLLKQNNCGVAAARNKGLTHAKGEFLYLLDSDDLIFPNALETLANMLSVGNWPYSLANIYSADASGQILIDDKSGIPKQSKHSILYNQWMTHAALYRRSTLLMTGLFNTSLIVGEDTEFQVRVAAKTGLGASTSKYIGLRRQHSFGHLSFKRTDLQFMGHAIRAELVLREWLKSANLKTQQNDVDRRISIIVKILRFGVAGDWKSKNDAVLLYQLAVDETAGKHNVLRLIAGVNWRPYYYCLFSIYVGLRRIRNTYRAIRKHYAG